MQFLFHIWGNTSICSVKQKLKAGGDPGKILDDFNSNPTSVLINYLSHANWVFNRRLEMYSLAEEL